MRAEAAGDPGPWWQQAILGRGRWDADGLRDIARDYVVESLATASGTDAGFTIASEIVVALRAVGILLPAAGRIERSGIAWQSKSP